MRPNIDWRLTVGSLLLAAGLGPAQAAAPAANAATSTARWNHGALEVTVDGANWSETIPFKALAQSRTYRQRFAHSTVTANQQMRPDGPSRTAQAQFKGQTWLRWGKGTAPLGLDTPGGWPYRLIADATAGPNQPQYFWSSADARERMVALPERIQTVRTPQATWCAWFTVTGTQETRPHIADGTVPSIRWMLWRRPANTSCSQ
jgi:hypothetical protein